MSIDENNYFVTVDISAPQPTALHLLARRYYRSPKTDDYQVEKDFGYWKIEPESANDNTPLNRKIHFRSWLLGHKNLDMERCREAIREESPAYAYEDYTPPDDDYEPADPR